MVIIIGPDSMATPYMVSGSSKATAFCSDKGDWMEAKEERGLESLAKTNQKTQGDNLASNAGNI